MRRIPACLVASLMISFGSVAWGQGRFALESQAPAVDVGGLLWDACRSPAVIEVNRDARGVPRDLGARPVFFRASLLGKDVVFVVSLDGVGVPHLWADTNADGDLSDEKPFPGPETTPAGYNYRSFEFGPITIRSAGREVAIRASVSNFRDAAVYCDLSLAPARVPAATVRLGGRNCRVVLFDASLDGRLTPWEPGGGENQDTLAIDLNGNGKWSEVQDAGEVIPIPRLLCVGDAWYSVRVAPDGSWIQFDAADPKFGTLDVGSVDAEIELAGESGFRRLETPGGKWRLPEGRYLLRDITIRPKDAAGDTWEMSSKGPNWGLPSRIKSKVTFEIRGGETTALKLGPPFTFVTEMVLKGGDAEIMVWAQGRGGERYEPVPGMCPRDVGAPSLIIYGESGKELLRDSFPYG